MEQKKGKEATLAVNPHYSLCHDNFSAVSDL